MILSCWFLSLFSWIRIKHVKIIVSLLLDIFRKRLLASLYHCQCSDRLQNRIGGESCIADCNTPLAPLGLLQPLKPNELRKDLQKTRRMIASSFSWWLRGYLGCEGLNFPREILYFLWPFSASHYGHSHSTAVVFWQHSHACSMLTQQELTTLLFSEPLRLQCTSVQQ